MLETSRKDFLKTLLLGVGAVAMPGLARAGSLLVEQAQTASKIELSDLKSFAKIAGLEFTDAELQEVLADVQGNPASFVSLRKTTDDYGLFPSQVFRVRGAKTSSRPRVSVRTRSARLTLPKGQEDLFYLTLVELGHLIRSKQITSVELTQAYLGRMKQLGPKLLCLVSLMEDRALAHAAKLDEEAKAGKWRGPLHGIPCGIKDLFATKGTPTQWGTAAFKGQMVDLDAAVVEKLEAAGAVIIAKLSLGALAMNDNWYGGRTKNPWNPSQGSSGSSAGSACAVAAGLVPFAIGTETSGSIMSPSHRCRVTGLRPTFGSISRYGAMALCWTMDKVGPICRTAEDCALVFSALLGADGRDAHTFDRDFVYSPLDNLKGKKIGVFGRPDPEARAMLEKAGATLSEWKLPAGDPSLGLIIACESATMFDQITRDGRLRQVTENEWPAFFRGARFIPAVEYLQAERARTRLIDAFAAAFEGFDAVLAPDHAVASIYNMNLVGFPQVLIPWGTTTSGVEKSVSLLGGPNSEATLLAIGHLMQLQKGAFRLRPDLTKL